MSTKTTGSTITTGTDVRLVIRLAAAALAWVGLYLLNERFWDILFAEWLSLDLSSRLWGAVHFFAYDSIKILMLLVGMMFVIGMLRTGVNAEAVRSWLEGRPLILALFLAAVLGVVTPFCSCSSIPLFIGFVAAGIPLSVTLTFLIASPLISEVAVIMMGDIFGWGPTAAYVVAGIAASMVIGGILSRFNLDDQVKDFVWRTPVAELHRNGRRPTLSQRVDAAKEEVSDIFTKVWLWVLVGVGLGAVIHGWIPEAFFLRYAGPDQPFAVVVATLAGAPLYANGAAIVPIAGAMYAKGMALGTTMSFIMATITLSLPEFILLRQVLKPRLLAIFFGSTTLAIMVIGFAFNFFA